MAQVIELEKGEFRADVHRADIILASVPTLGRRAELSGFCDRLLRFDPAEFKCIIIDEAHHSAAPSYQRVLEHFGAFRDDSHLLVWGCSATLRRNDHLALGSLFQKIVYHVDMAQMIEEGWLSRAELHQIYTEFNVDAVTVDSSGDFSLDDLSLVLNTPHRNRLVAETWKAEAVDKHKRQATIVFAINIAHVHGLAVAFAAVSGVRPAIITGQTDSYERAQILSDFSLGHIPVIINCGVLTEGTDLPITDCVLMARPTCNSSLYIQMAGRGLRKHPAKDYCLILDIIDRMKSPKRSLVTFPTLLSAKPAKAADPPDTADDMDSMDSKSTPRGKHVKELNFGAVCVRVDRKSLSLVNLENERLAWVAIPGYPIHILECSEFRIVLAEEATDQFTCVVTAKKREEDADFDGFERSPSHTHKQTIGERLRLAHMLPLVDAFLAEYEQRTGSSVQTSMLANAFWRRSFPPSRKQLAILLAAARQYQATRPEISALYTTSKGRAAMAISRHAFLKSIKCCISRPWSDIFN